MSQLDAYFTEVDERQGPVTADQVGAVLNNVHELPPPAPAPIRQRPKVWVAATAAVAVVVAIGVVPMLVNSQGTDSPPATEALVSTTTEPITPNEPTTPPQAASAEPFGVVQLTPSGTAQWLTGGLQHGVVYVDSVDKVFMNGGALRSRNTAAIDQTVLIDLETLTADRLDIPGPPARVNHAVAYDRKSDRVILFGGTASRNSPYGDTWAFDPVAETWEEMAPAASPQPSTGHDLVYHETSDRVIYVGNDGVWAYNYEDDDWERYGEYGMPWDGGYIPGSAVVHEASGLVLAVTAGTHVEVFDVARRDWSGGPPELELWTRPFEDVWTTSIAYEPSSQRIIEYSGVRGGIGAGVVLAFDLETESWTRIGSAPDLGFAARMIHDPIRNQMVVIPGRPQGPDSTSDDWRIWTAPTSSLSHESVDTSATPTRTEASDLIGAVLPRLIRADERSNARNWLEADGRYIDTVTWGMDLYDPPADGDNPGPLLAPIPASQDQRIVDAQGRIRSVELWADGYDHGDPSIREASVAFALLLAVTDPGLPTAQSEVIDAIRHDIEPDRRLITECFAGGGDQTRPETHAVAIVNIAGETIERAWSATMEGFTEWHELETVACRIRDLSTDSIQTIP